MSIIVQPRSVLQDTRKKRNGYYPSDGPFYTIPEDQEGKYWMILGDENDDQSFLVMSDVCLKKKNAIKLVDRLNILVRRWLFIEHGKEV